LFITTSFVFATIFSACGGLSEAQIQELNSLRNEVASLEREANSLKDERAKLEKRIEETNRKLAECKKQKDETKANLEKLPK
jgi:septal ring factor EnvC (AmiA/AmiB activator)